VGVAEQGSLGEASSEHDGTYADTARPVADANAIAVLDANAVTVADATVGHARF
jgi:hypothetical protein